MVVIDALDESGDREERTKLLSIFRKFTAQLRKDFRFVISSRPEEDIAISLFLNPLIKVKRLDDIERQSTDADIYVMVSELLPSIPTLDVQYPDQQWRYMLVQKAEGIFQWAATACLVIRGNGKRRNSRKQFEAVMAAESHLYSLYLTVLNGIFEITDSEDMVTFRTILGAVLVAREPLTFDALSNLYSGEDSDFIISPLGSLLSGTADDNPITPLHTSFRDFLSDPVHAGVFLVDHTVANKQMSLATLQCLNRDLHFNMGILGTSYLQSIMQVDLPKHIIYSSRFWADHVSHVTLSFEVPEKVKIFLHSNFLYWLEVLSLTGNMAVAIPSLSIANQVSRSLHMKNNN